MSSAKFRPFCLVPDANHTRTFCGLQGLTITHHALRPDAWQEGGRPSQVRGRYTQDLKGHHDMQQSPSAISNDF